MNLLKEMKMYVIAFSFMENLLPALCALFKAVPSAGAESQEEPDLLALTGNPSWRGANGGFIPGYS